MSSQVPATPSTPPEAAKAQPIWATFELKRIPFMREDTSMYPFQMYSVYRALTTSRFLFGLATGTGKTICSYAAFFYYRVKFPNTKLIILTNKSAVLQYYAEQDKFFDVPGYKAVAINPKMKRLHNMSGKTYADCRKQAYDGFAQPTGGMGSVDCLIFNYSVFMRDWKTFGKYVANAKKNGEHIFLIADEATKFQNMQSETHRCVASLARMCERAVAATATVTKGKLEQVYSIFKAIGVQLYQTKEQFMDQHCITFVPPGGNRFAPQIAGYKNLPQFVELIKPYSIVLRKQDVAPFLPKFTASFTYPEHSEAQYELIKNIYTGFLNLATLRDIDAETAGGKTPEMLLTEQQKQEEAADTVMGGDFKVIQKLTEHGFIKRGLLDPRLVSRENLQNYSKEFRSPKTQEIIDALAEQYTDEKIVIYTNSRVYLQLLAESIRRAPEVPEFYRKVLEIRGGIDDVTREESRLKFYNSKDHNLMILNDAGIEALNLQASNTMLVTTMPRSAGDLVQLAGRISRIGSTHTGLSIRYLLTENSQDMDEYAAIQTQLLVMYFAQGESEEGLLDWGFLQKYYGVKKNGLKEALDKDELLQKTGTQLMLAKREARAKDYI